MKSFSIVVAMDEEKGIGKAGALAWRLPGELKHFKILTTAVKDISKSNAVIMGRKTWESLPDKYRPLPGRLNVVLSSAGSALGVPNGVLVLSSLDHALQVLSVNDQIEQVFVIGGANLYAQAISHDACNAIFVTDVQAIFDCDVFFPPIPAVFRKSDVSPLVVEDDIAYRFVDYQIVK